MAVSDIFDVSFQLCMATQYCNVKGQSFVGAFNLILWYKCMETSDASIMIVRNQQ